MDDQDRETENNAAPGRAERWEATARRVVRAIRHADERAIADAVTGLTRAHPWLAPLAFLVGGIAMLLGGVRLLFSNWRLTLVQILPAAWIWLAMYDLRAYMLRGDSLGELRGPILSPIVLAIVAITAGCFFLNTVFGFAVVQPGRPQVRPAVAEARKHLPVILGSGSIVGLALGVTVTFLPRVEPPWFVLSLGVVIGVMMVAYVAIPARLIGIRPSGSRRDRLSASAIGTALGVLVSTPPYLLGRVGLLMLGSPVLFVPGLILFALGVTLQAGATGAVKAVKMSAKLSTPR